MGSTTKKHGIPIENEWLTTQVPVDTTLYFASLLKYWAIHISAVRYNTTVTSVKLMRDAIRPVFKDLWYNHNVIFYIFYSCRQKIWQWVHIMTPGIILTEILVMIEVMTAIATTPIVLSHCTHYSSFNFSNKCYVFPVFSVQFIPPSLHLFLHFPPEEPVRDVDLPVLCYETWHFERATQCQERFCSRSLFSKEKSLTHWA